MPHIAIEGPTISPEGIQVFTSAYPMLVGLDTSDELLAYSTVRVMHENYETYKNNAPGASGWRIDRQKFEQAFVPFHPGAIRYYKEIGAWTPEAEANNQKNLHRQSVLKTAWDAFFPTAPEDYVEFEQAWVVAREAALAEADLITLGEGL